MPRPQVSEFIRKRNFFPQECSFVHTYPVKTITENSTFKYALQSQNFWSRRFPVLEKRWLNGIWCHGDKIVSVRMPWPFCQANSWVKFSFEVKRASYYVRKRLINSDLKESKRLTIEQRPWPSVRGNVPRQKRKYSFPNKNCYLWKGSYVGVNTTFHDSVQFILSTSLTPSYIYFKSTSSNF